MVRAPHSAYTPRCMERSLVETMERFDETVVTENQEVRLPAQALHWLGWKPGDRLTVTVLGADMIVLSRRPESRATTFAGRLSHVFGTHDENRRYLEEERRSWDDE